MTRSLSFLAVLATGAGCSAASTASKAGLGETGCDAHITTVSLEASPSTLTRATSAQVTITWELSDSPRAPALLYLASSPGYEVELETTMSGGPSGFSTSLVNPFGPGTPAGDITVYAWLGVPLDCPPPPSATTSLALE